MPETGRDNGRHNRSVENPRQLIVIALFKLEHAAESQDSCQTFRFQGLALENQAQ